MAWYVAHHHVGLSNYVARPGEVVEADLSPETEARLIRLGAIEKLNMSVQEPEIAAALGAEKPESAGELGLRVLEEEAEEFAAISEEDAAEEEPAPMEIDPTEAVKPAKKGGRRK